MFDSKPQGYDTLTPYLTVRDAAGAIAYYQQALGAVERMRLVDPAGKIAHAELTIGDSKLMLADEYPEFDVVAPTPDAPASARLHLYCDDVDTLFDRAVAAGGKALIPVSDQFYGDRSGRLLDPYGHVWILSTQRETLSPEEMQRRFDAMAGQDGPPDG